MKSRKNTDDKLDSYIKKRDNSVERLQSLLNKITIDDQTRGKIQNLIHILKRITPDYQPNHEAFVKLTEEIDYNEETEEILADINTYYYASLQLTGELKKNNLTVINKSGLLYKVLTGRSTENHMLTKDEIESVIHHLDYQSQIFVGTFEKESLEEIANKAANYNNTYNPYSFYLILNNTNDIHTPGDHWISAKITVNPTNVLIEYADSGKICSDYDEITSILKEKYKPKMIVSRKQNNVITQRWNYECGYLSLFNCIRDINGLSQIGGWCNDYKQFASLYYWLQKFALLGLNFHKNDANFNHRKDKDEILRIDESNDDKPYHFKSTFIENTLKPKTPDLPFY